MTAKVWWIAESKKEETKGKSFDIVWQARWGIIKAWAKELTVRIEKKKGGGGYFKDVKGNQYVSVTDTTLC